MQKSKNAKMQKMQKMVKNQRKCMKDKRYSIGKLKKSEDDGKERNQMKMTKINKRSKKIG